MEIIIIGSNGLTGKALLENLLLNEKVEKITSIARKRLDNDSPKLDQIVFPNMTEKTLNDLHLQGDVFISCLGSTIKKAGSKKNFRKVDYNLVLSFAQMAKRGGAKLFQVISSKGSDKNSLFFYNKVKGEVEVALEALSFPSLYIYRPSLLIGEREENRPGEKIGVKLVQLISPLITKSLEKKVGTKVEELAQRMCLDILKFNQGNNVIESEQI